MNITNKTVLITGGGSGIGFEIAKLLSQKGNQVIITGRSEVRLQQAVAQLNNVSYLVCDVTNGDDVQKLAASITNLDILINNAGAAYYYPIDENAGAYQKASEEMQTNFLSVIRLTETLLPALQKSAEAAIVNVTSILALVPAAGVSTYSASKAALHSYTQSLRYALAKAGTIKVFELMPPLVNTDFSKDIGGENGIPPAQVADDLLTGFENDQFELHVGQTADIYKLSLASPQDAFIAINSRER